MRWSRHSGPDYGWGHDCQDAARRDARSVYREETATTTAPLWPPCVLPASSAAPPARPAGRIRSMSSSSNPRTRRSPPDTGPVSAAGRSRTNGTAPAWLDPLLAALERDPRRRWTDADLAANGFRPEAVRRWFRRRFGRTFHDYARTRRLAAAVGTLQRGAPVTDAAFDHGYESLSGFADAVRTLIGTSPRAAGAARLLAVTPVETPLGVMLLGAAEGKLCLAEFSDPARLEAQTPAGAPAPGRYPGPGGAKPRSRTPRRNSRSTSPAAGGTSICPCCRPAPSCSDRYGRRCCGSPMAKRGATAR